MKKAFIFLSLFWCATVFAGDPFLKFADSSLGFSIEYPSSWKGTPLAASGLVSFVPGSKEAAPAVGVGDSFKVLVQKLDHPVSVEEFVAEESKYSAKLGAGPIQGSKIKLGSLDSIKSEDKKNILNTDLLITKYYVVKGNKAFVLTATSPVAKSAALKPLFEKMAASFVAY